MRYLSGDLGFHGGNGCFLCLFLLYNTRRTEERFHFDVQLPPWIRTESIVRKKIVLNDSKGFMTIQSFLCQTTLHVSSHGALKRGKQLLHISIPFLFQFSELHISTFERSVTNPARKNTFVRPIWYILRSRSRLDRIICAALRLSINPVGNPGVSNSYRCRNSMKVNRFGNPVLAIRIPSNTPLHRN